MLWHDTERCFVYSWHQSWTTPVLTEYVSPSKVSKWRYFYFAQVKQQLLNVHLSGPVDGLTKYLCSLSSQFVFLHTSLQSTHIGLKLTHYGSNILFEAQVVSFCWSSSMLPGASSIKDKYFWQLLTDFLVVNEFDLISISWARGVCGNKRDLGRVCL